MILINRIINPFFWRLMGEAKRRKELGIPPREKTIEFPKFDKESVQKMVRATLYKYPIIPFLFMELQY